MGAQFLETIDISIQCYVFLYLIHFNSNVLNIFLMGCENIPLSTGNLSKETALYLYTKFNLYTLSYNLLTRLFGGRL